MIDADIEWDGSEPVLVVNRAFAVCKEPYAEARKRHCGECFPRLQQREVDMIAAGGWMKALGLEIIDRAEDDDGLFQDALAAHDIVAVGHPNDPDAGYIVKGARI